MTASQLGDVLGLHPRGTYDFFDALVALNFLDREGDGPEGRYTNTPETSAFLNKKSPAYIGGLAEMLNSRLFGFWNDLLYYFQDCRYAVYEYSRLYDYGSWCPGFTSSVSAHYRAD